MTSPRKPKPYVEAQSEIEAAVDALAVASGFVLASRDRKFAGRGSLVAWRRAVGWRTDQLRLLFRWGSGRFRQVYADVSTEIILPERPYEVDGYPAGWIARSSSQELRIKAADAHAPAKVIETIWSDLSAAIAWLDETYATPSAAAVRIMSRERNGPGVGTAVHQAILEHLHAIAGGSRTDGG